ncbi:MAG: hypothetical protein ABL958_14150, partial [Bdellovibrionia bacterium]
AALAAAEEIGISRKQIKGTHAGPRYLPSAGGSGELVSQIFVEIEFSSKTVLPAKNPHGFKTKSTIRALPATQTLRAYCAGGMFDNRLEIAIYTLLLANNEPWGPWIGDELNKDPDSTKEPRAELEKNSRVVSLEKILAPAGADFEQDENSADFLEVLTSLFAEESSASAAIAEARLEYVVPKTRSLETVVLLPWILEKGTYYAGVEARRLPAAQKYFGDAGLPCAPAWRLTVENCARGLETSVQDLTARDFGNGSFTGRAPLQLQRLGSSYMPSLGTSPETCHLFTANGSDLRGLNWVPLEELVAQTGRIRSGHLLTAALRLSHALKS